MLYHILARTIHEIMAKVPQSKQIYFWTNTLGEDMNTLIPTPSYGLNSLTAVLQE